MDTTGKELFRDVVEEVWHRGNLAFIREAFATSFVGNAPRNPLQTLESYRRHVAEARAAFPDVRMDVKHQVAEGDLVASRYLIRGTHLGEFMGMAPTGRPITVEAMTMQRLSRGRIAESWTTWDLLGLMRSIGMLPASNLAA